MYGPWTSVFSTERRHCENLSLAHRDLHFKEAARATPDTPRYRSKSDEKKASRPSADARFSVLVGVLIPSTPNVDVGPGHPMDGRTGCVSSSP